MTGQVRAFIVAAAEREALRKLVESLGLHVAGVAAEGREAVVQAEALQPDVILLEHHLPALDGIAITYGIMARRPTPVILCTADLSPSLVDRALVAGVMGFLPTPCRPKDLPPALALAVARFGDLIRLRHEVRTLQQAIVLRKDLDRAKGILGQRLGLAEAEAHRRLQSLATRDRCTLSDAALRVLAADQFFRDLEALS